MLVMIQKSIIDGISLAIRQYIKANNRYMNNYDKNKESPNLKNWDVNNLYRPATSQNLPGGGFKWVKRK